MHLRAPKRPGKEQLTHDVKEGKRGLEGEGANGDGKGGVQGGALVVPGVRRAAAVTAFRLEDGQYKVSQG